MLFKRVKIETSNLERGMYVAQLDRPWLETPFLFQGFEIREDGDLKLLHQYCSHVYVDISRSHLPKEKILTAANDSRKVVFAGQPPTRRPITLLERLLRTVGELDPTGRLLARINGHRRYRNTVPVRTEAPRAIRAYDTAAETMNDVLKQIQRGAVLEIDKVQTAITPLIDSAMRNQDAMAWLVWLRKHDEYTYHHSIASSVWAVVLGQHIGLDRQGLETLAMGGMLLDIGKAKLPQSLMSKVGVLSDAEVELMRKHVEYGVEMAKAIPGINENVLTMIEGHHERYDGSGYPKGLKGNAIPVFARIAGLIDCYDAMTTHRVWAQAKSPYDAIREFHGLARGQFQVELVEQFVQAIGMFPTGSLVELNTGEIGIVIEQNRIRRLRPKVRLLLDADKSPLPSPKTVDLRNQSSNQLEQRAIWIVRGHESGAFGIDPKDHFTENVNAAMVP